MCDPVGVAKSSTSDGLFDEVKPHAATPPAPTTVQVKDLVDLPKNLVASDLGPGHVRFSYQCFTNVDNATGVKLRDMAVELGGSLGYVPTRAEMLRRVLVWYVRAASPRHDGVVSTSSATPVCQSPPPKPTVNPVAAWLQSLATVGEIKVVIGAESTTLKLDRRQALPCSAVFNTYKSWIFDRVGAGDLFIDVADTVFIDTLKGLLGNIQGPDDIYVLPTAAVIKEKLATVKVTLFDGGEIATTVAPTRCMCLRCGVKPVRHLATCSYFCSTECRENKEVTAGTWELRVYANAKTRGRMDDVDVNRILGGKDSSVVFTGTKAQCEREASMLDQLYSGLKYHISQVCPPHILVKPFN